MAGKRSPTVIINEQGTPQEKFIKYSVGFFIVLYLAFLWGAAWLPECSITEWMNNFYEFVWVEHHFIVGVTKATPACVCIFEIAWTLGYLYFITAIKHPYRGREHGDARWGDVVSFSKKFMNHDKKNEVEVNFGDCPAPQYPVTVNTHNYWIAEGCYVNLDNKLTSNLNFLIVGPPGTGKTFRLARPILSMLAGCFLVTDPKGELSKQTGQYFEDNGYEVLVLNVESEEAMEHSIHFNPFRYLRNESDIMSLAQILFKATSTPGDKPDAFFENSAEVLLTCILYLMHYTYPEKKKNWKCFVELLESTAVKQDPQTMGIDNSDENGIYNRFLRADEEWKKGTYTNGIPQTEHIKGFVDVEKFYTGAQETTSGIAASLDAHCKYMKLNCVKELLSEDDIDITNSFGYCKKSKKSPTGKRILYIVTSEDKRYYDWITSMIYSLFFDELYHLTTIDPSLHDTLPEHLTFLMDEFNNITLPDSFVDRLSTMRSRGMSAIVIVQNLMQLKNKFPENDLDKNLIGNMSIIDILGAPDIDSCEYLSKMFGTMTIHKQTTGLTRGTQGSFSENEDVMEKPLFSQEDMFGMDKDGPCAIAIKGTDPLWVQKCKFEDSPLYPLLTRKKPYRAKHKTVIENRFVDYSKSLCDQLPDILIGDDAESYLQSCREDGIKVAVLREEELDLIATLDSHHVPVPGCDATTQEYWNAVYDATAKAIEEERRNTLDLDSYTSDQLIVVQRLRNKGFEPIQIKGLDKLIRAGYEYEEIVKYFGVHMSSEEIEEFSERLSQARNIKSNFGGN